MNLIEKEYIYIIHLNLYFHKVKIKNLKRNDKKFRENKPFEKFKNLANVYMICF